MWWGCWIFGLAKIPRMQQEFPRSSRLLPHVCVCTFTADMSRPALVRIVHVYRCVRRWCKSSMPCVDDPSAALVLSESGIIHGMMLIKA
jgi:hypothetical protein